MTITILKSKNGRWFYRGKARNGRIVAPSQTYSRRWSAKRAAMSLFPKARFV